MKNVVDYIFGIWEGVSFGVIVGLVIAAHFPGIIHSSMSLELWSILLGFAGIFPTAVLGIVRGVQKYREAVKKMSAGETVR